uniref:Uncharacterized protein n=1 Tax=Proboscia inermis TaxID=420281 RepID=A0A7S0CI79_9STRA|mmetsp:Transcript_48401/g.48741  ORF Transcript_48401/g.48741 Transcript_48401/m.48741 type:complete len:255 (+) Transcript_48401:632-1396(+)
MAKYGKTSAGMREQVPWGKHTPVHWRLHHKAIAASKDVNQADVLPVLAIKDPFTWMTSMCRHPYAAEWYHGDDRCPNLVALTEKELMMAKTQRKHDTNIGNGKMQRLRDDGTTTIPVSVRYAAGSYTHHESLVDLWNTYYKNWVTTASSSPASDSTGGFPHLVIRFEDLIFHTEYVITSICGCAGGTIKQGTAFSYVGDSAKQGQSHEGSSGLFSALSRYGNSTLRIKSFQKEDLKFARKELDFDLLKYFHYNG